MKKLKLISFVFVMVLLQNCKTKHTPISLKTSFGKVSSYAGTCESAQGFCSEIVDEFSNGTIQRAEKSFKMKLKKEDIPKNFIDEIIKTKTLTVQKDFFLSEKLTDKLFEKEKEKYKIKINKGKYLAKIEGKGDNLKIIIHFKPPADVYVNGKYLGKFEWVIIID